MPELDGLLIVAAGAFAAPFLLGLFRSVGLPALVLVRGPARARLPPRDRLSVLPFPIAAITLLRGGRLPIPAM
jgi:hypothetical protein